MLKFSANPSMLFPEVPLLERFQCASALDCVEKLNQYHGSGDNQKRGID